MQSSGLDLYYKTSAELIFNVLGASKTFKNSAFNHDTHFRAKSFSFFHTVCCENNCTCFSLCDLRDHRPHESSCFRVHAS
jgi:hypothetical protein